MYQRVLSVFKQFCNAVQDSIKPYPDVSVSHDATHFVCKVRSLELCEISVERFGATILVKCRFAVDFVSRVSQIKWHRPGEKVHVTTVETDGSKSSAVEELPNVDIEHEFRVTLHLIARHLGKMIGLELQAPG
jgi:hypothetical protein